MSFIENTEYQVGKLRPELEDETVEYQTGKQKPDLWEEISHDRLQGIKARAQARIQRDIDNMRSNDRT